jgi:hypothetical protein
MTPFTPPGISSPTRAEIVELIRRIQSDGCDGKELRALERATGNPNVWIIFNELETEGMSPDKIFDLFFATNSQG